MMLWCWFIRSRRNVLTNPEIYHLVNLKKPFMHTGTTKNQGSVWEVPKIGTRNKFCKSFEKEDLWAGDSSRDQDYTPLRRHSLGRNGPCLKPLSDLSSEWESVSLSCINNFPVA